MSTEVANVFGSKLDLTSSTELAAKMMESGQNSPRGSAPDGSEYMNFSGKSGIYSIGSEERKIQDDELFVANIASFQDGFVCWKGGNPVAIRMTGSFDGVPIPTPSDEEHGPFDRDKGEGWFQAKALVLKSLDYDQQGYFRINSVSGVDALASFQREIAERMQSGVPYWPVISLSSTEFTAKGFKNYKPKFTIEGWLASEVLGELLENEYDLDDLMAKSANPSVVEDKSEEVKEESKKTTRKRSRL